jgi:CMP-N,N'-diacetyllegionaminic acid synthase
MPAAIGHKQHVDVAHEHHSLSYRCLNVYTEVVVKNTGVSLHKLALIPARGGSKRIPGKNLVDVCGKPMIAHTILAALESGVFKRVVVSTDDSEIAEVSRLYGAEVPFDRPPELARDDTPSVAVVLHAMEQLRPDCVTVLQPTSPLRTADDIVAADARMTEIARPVISVAETKPWLLSTDENGGLFWAFNERQGKEGTQRYFVPNGAIYSFLSEVIWKGGSWWDNAVAYEMPLERSIDIDTPSDLYIARALLAGRINNAGEA